MEITPLFFSCCLILIASIAGGLIPLVSGLTHTRLQVYLSFSAGIMLGTSLFHMIPAAIELLGSDLETSLPITMRWLTSGLLCLFFIERFFSFHHHEVPSTSPTEHDHHGSPHLPNTLKHLSWGPAMVGFSLHTLASGMALASAFNAQSPSEWLGIWVCASIVLHKPADSLTIVTLLIHGQSTRKHAHLINVLFSLMVPLGVLLFYTSRTVFAVGIESAFTGRVLAFSAGTFLCLSLSDLLPELQFHQHDRWKLSFSLLLGVLLMLAVAQVHSY